MSPACEKRNDYGTRIDFRGSRRSLWYRGFSVTRRPWSSNCDAGEKTFCGACGRAHRTFYDHKMRRVRDLSCGDRRVRPDVEIRRVLCRSCGKVKQESLEWLANHPFYTRRFSFWVGRRCRVSTIRDVARETRLDWKTIKALERQYMEAQLGRAGTPGPQVIGIDELSVRKGHTYRIIVSDLVRKRQVWFGGTDRSKASMKLFFEWLGEKKKVLPDFSLLFYLLSRDIYRR